MNKKLSEMSNEELIEEFISYDEIINKIGCYGTRDLRYFNNIINEIEEVRKGTITYNGLISFNESDDE